MMTPERFAEIVFEHYMEHGRGANAKEIAARAKCSLGTIYRFVGCAGYPINRTVQVFREERERYSTDYPGMSTGGSVRFMVWAPTLSYMRDKLLAHTQPKEGTEG